MESRNNLCNVRGIIASLSERVETMKRRNDEMPERNDITTNDDEPGWSVMSRTRKTTNRTDKMTRRTNEAMSLLLKMAIRTVNSTRSAGFCRG